MIHNVALLTIATALLTAVFAVEPIKPLYEIETQGGFTKYFGAHELGIVQYSSTNCQGCGDLTRELRAAVESIQQQTGIAIPIARIVHDTTDFETAQLYHQEPHYGPPTPSLAVVRYGQLVMHRFRGKTNTAAEIEAYLKVLLRNPYQLVATPDEARRLVPLPAGFPRSHATGRDIAKQRIVVFAFLHHVTPLARAFESLSDWYRDVDDVVFAKTTRADVASVYRVAKDTAAIGIFHEAFPGTPFWLTPTANTEADYPQMHTALESFLALHARPFVEFSQDRFQRAAHDPKSVVETSAVVYFTCPGASADGDPATAACLEQDKNQLVDSIMVPLRNSMHPTIERLLVIARELRSTQISELKQCGIPSQTIEAFNSSSSEVSLAFCVMHKLKPHGHPEAFKLSASAAALAEFTSFVKSVRSNEVLHHMRSLPVPRNTPQPGGGELVTLVGRNFESYIKKPDLSSFVMLYSHNCGPACDEALELMKDLAHVFAGRKNLAIVAIDGDMNELPRDFNRHSFPQFAYVSYLNGLPEWYGLDDKTFPAMWEFVISRQLDWNPEIMKLPKDPRGARSKVKGIEDYDGPPKRKRLVRPKDEL